MKKVIIILLIILGFCGLIYFLLPFIVSTLHMARTTDKQIIDTIINQKLPGYTGIEILKTSGGGTSSVDPRLIALKVTLDNGDKPTTCEGEAFEFGGDPGNIGLILQTLECEGLVTLINNTQTTISPEYDPNILGQQLGGFRTFYSCFSQQIASVLYYWIKHGKITIDDIRWPEIKGITEEMLAGKLNVQQQIVLFDPNKREIIDLAPNEPTSQIVRQYYLRCDGTIREYRAKTNIDIYNNLKSDFDFSLGNPLSEASDQFKIK